MGKTQYDFSDDCVVITGGASGIGREVALAFGEAGATVVVADIRQDPKDTDASVPTHERITEEGGRAMFVETDVTDPEDLRAVLDAAKEVGGVDVMVNNAGLFVEGSIREVSPGDLGRVLDVNVRGVFVGTQLAAEKMLPEGGVIVNTASISSDLAQHGQAAYDATKGAVRMITRSAALELAPEIRVNAVAPGQIATEFLEGWTEEATEKAGDSAGQSGFLKPIPMARAGRPADVAPAMLWLASDDAGYTTGELLHVDGGWQVC